MARPGPKRLVDLLLGLEAMQPVSAFIARMGMRGAGIGLHFRPENSGEARLLRRIGRKYPGFSCLDVGANVGRYALAALDGGAGRVVAVEPSPRTFEILAKNTEGRPVERVLSAVGEEKGETVIFVPANLGHASRDAAAGGFREEEAERITAPMTTIDDYCFERSFFPTLIKIDIEGFELEALAGAQKLLAHEQRPAFVQFEFNIHHLHRRQRLDDLAALLPGYTLYRLTASGLSRVGAHRGMDMIYAFMNVVACRDERPF